MTPGRWALLGMVAGATLALIPVVRRVRAVDLQGRVAIVTGGSRGLGLRLAEVLVEHGAHVALVARDPRGLARARAHLEAAGGSIHTIPADVSDADAAAQVVQSTLDRFGRLDVLINNAGIITVGPLSDMSLEDFERHMNVHFWGPLRLSLASLPHLERSTAGRIVNIASIGGRIAVPHLAPYAASKAALVGLSDALRVELAPRGVRVTTVCPGLMRTGSYLHALFKGRARSEAAWFTASSVAPGLAMDAGRAARTIVEACRRGDAYSTFNVFATLAIRVEGVAPALVRRLGELAELALPASPAGRFGRAGIAGRRLHPTWMRGPLRELGERAARRHLQRIRAGG